MSSVEEFPRIGSVKAPDDDGLQERRLEIAQVHAVASARLRREWFPMRDDAARPAADVPQGSIAPDVTFGVLGVTLDRH